MVGHDDEGMQLAVVAELRCLLPLAVGDGAVGVEHHGAIGYMAEELRPVLTAERDKIPPRLSVIIALEADRSAVMHVRRVAHEAGKLSNKSL